ncbi:HugZ family pyridoxamine 5'-phosphate oxidase [Sphaerotilus natans]|uniref:HugZ family pyridoxamine 5'-phosphate oxidase n=1 Tax=Sphaerotilus natans TaxID=34103 RepID=UPI00406C5CE4
MNNTHDGMKPALAPSRMDRRLVELLRARRTLALGTLDETGAPAVSMAPWALDPAGPDLIVLISALAAHTRQLQAHPRASALICADEEAADSVHALARATLQVEALHPEPGSDDARAALAIYIARHPAGEMLASLPDFRVVRLRVQAARQIAGFGAARDVSAARLRELLRESDNSAT